MFGFKKPDAEKADGVEPFEGIDPQTGAVVTASSDEERKFVRRLDMFLLTFGCISQVSLFQKHGTSVTNDFVDRSLSTLVSDEDQSSSSPLC